MRIEWNGHHYLIQGYRGKEFFVHSKTGQPGTWENWTDRKDALYAGLVVPMVVSIPGNRRLLVGWRPESGKAQKWGGSMELRELDDTSFRQWHRSSQLWPGQVRRI